MQIHITVQWEISLRGDLSSKFISTLQAAIPESCRALYVHCLISLQSLHHGDTSFFFFLHCLKLMPFVMYFAKLELTSCCLLGAGRREIQIYAMLLFGYSVKTLSLGR